MIQSVPSTRVVLEIVVVLVTSAAESGMPQAVLMRVLPDWLGSAIKWPASIRIKHAVKYAGYLVPWVPDRPALLF